MSASSAFWLAEMMPPTKVSSNSIDPDRIGYKMRLRTVIPNLFILIMLLQGCKSFEDFKQAALPKIDAAALEAKLPLVYDVTYLKVDSAGGVSLKLNFRNTSDKDFKSLNFNLIPFNSAGDKVSSSMGKKTEAGLSITGPIKSGPSNQGPEEQFDRQNQGLFGGIWYNATISCVRVTSIEITFMNNQKKLIKAKGEIDKMNAIYRDAVFNQDGISDFDREWNASAICAPKAP